MGLALFSYETNKFLSLDSYQSHSSLPLTVRGLSFLNEHMVDLLVSSVIRRCRDSFVYVPIWETYGAYYHISAKGGANEAASIAINGLVNSVFSFPIWNLKSSGNILKL